MPAVKWDMMEKPQAVDATVPKAKKQEREIWTAVSGRCLFQNQ